MIILGIDPGLINTGFGIISIQDNKPSLVDYGIISPNRKDCTPNRLFTIYSDVLELIGNYNPTIFSIEDVFYSKNFKSALMLGQARGAAILAAAKFNIPIFEK